VEALVDDRVELRVQALDAFDGGVDQLEGTGLATPHELGLRGGVEDGEVGIHARERRVWGRWHRATTSNAGGTTTWTARRWPGCRSWSSAAWPSSAPGPCSPSWSPPSAPW